MAGTTNYPDLLGYVTGGDRLNVGIVQVAGAVQPSEPVRAGRTLQVIVMAQNASSADMDLIVTVLLPDVDARRQRGRFTVKSQRYVIGVKAAEVGYLMIPVAIALDAAPDSDYRVGLEIDAKPLGKMAERVRDRDGGRFNPEFLSKEALDKLNELKKLSFGAHKRTGRNIIDVTFRVDPPRLNQQPEDLKAGWISIAKIVDYRDPRLAMFKYGDVITTQLFPKLKREELLEPLVEATKERFAAGGFPLRDPEARLIAKLLTLILEYAAPKDTQHGYVSAGGFDIKSMLLKDPRELDMNIKLPHWFQGMLGAIARDERAAAFPAKVIPKLLYTDLLHDAIIYGFNIVHTASGEDLGTAAEIEDYAAQLIDRLGKGGLDFSRAYLPLVMGGILINDKVLTAKEDPVEQLREIGKVIEERVFEISDDDTPIYEMANQLLMQVGHRYGFYK